MVRWQITTQKSYAIIQVYFNQSLKSLGYSTTQDTPLHVLIRSLGFTRGTFEKISSRYFGLSNILT